MAVYPGAKYRPLNQFSDQGARPRRGVVLHVNDGDAPSLYGWIAGDNGMSCHWQVAKDGTVEQYVDTDNGSWCQMAGNDDWLSIESQGFPGEPLTQAQVTAIGGIMRWVHATHAVPLVLSESPNQAGLGWHGMGGAAWGGHTGCPGELRKSQRTAILAVARGTTTTTEDDMSAADVAAINKHTDDVVGLVLRGDAKDGPKGDTHPANLGRIYTQLGELAAQVAQLTALVEDLHDRPAAP